MESKIIKEMNECLKSVFIEKKFILHNNISISPNGVIISSSSEMHQILEDYIYPPIKELEVYHYTSIEAANNIRKNKNFRLYNILKRYHEGELSPFLSKFGFNEAFDEYGKIKDINSYKNIFYASFVKVPENGIDTEEMKYFDSLNDKRLKFKIKSTKKFFRKIKYEDDKHFSLFLNLKKIANKYEKKFLIEGMSGRFASFCIDNSNKIENEYRIYWRHWNTDDGFSIKKDDDNDRFIEIKLNKENFSGIKIELI